MRLVLIFMLFGCATVQPQMDTQKLYRKDMAVKVDGVKMYGGTYVLNKRKAYEIKAYLYTRSVVVFKASSCHREIVWMKPGKDVEFIYKPLNKLENDGYCPLELGGFDTKAQHSWAFFDFINEENAPANLACNGVVSTVYGVSICQTRSGLIQRIEFQGRMEGYNLKRCNKAETEDYKTFTIEVNRGKCVYFFRGKTVTHRLTTLGYDDVIVRD